MLLAALGSEGMFLRVSLTNPLIAPAELRQELLESMGFTPATRPGLLGSPLFLQGHGLENPKQGAPRI